MKLTERQIDLLWSGGGGPYSQVNLIKQVRILDDAVSRTFLEVEVEINPTTFRLIKKHRNNNEFKNDVIVQQLLDSSEYRGPEFGYVSLAFSAEYTRTNALKEAEKALKYSQETIIKMHKFIIDMCKTKY